MDLLPQLLSRTYHTEPTLRLRSLRAIQEKLRFGLVQPAELAKFQPFLDAVEAWCDARYQGKIISDDDEVSCMRGLWEQCHPYMNLKAEHKIAKKLLHGHFSAAQDVRGVGAEESSNLTPGVIKGHLYDDAAVIASLFDPSWSARAGLTAELCAKLTHPTNVELCLESVDIVTRMCDTHHREVVVKLLFEDGNVVKGFHTLLENVVKRLKERPSAKDCILLHATLHSVCRLLTCAMAQNHLAGDRNLCITAMLYLPPFLGTCVTAIQCHYETYAAMETLKVIRKVLNTAVERGVEKLARNEESIATVQVVIRNVRGALDDSDVITLDDQGSIDTNGKYLEALEVLQSASCHLDIFRAVEIINSNLHAAFPQEFQSTLLDCTHRFITRPPANNFDKVMYQRLCRLWCRILTQHPYPEIITRFVDIVTLPSFLVSDVLTENPAAVEMILHVMNALGCGNLTAVADNVLQSTQILSVLVTELRRWESQSASVAPAPNSSVTARATVQYMLQVSKNTHLYVAFLCARTVQVILTYFGDAIRKAPNLMNQIIGMIPILCHVSSLNLPNGVDTFGSLIPKIILRATQILRSGKVSWLNYVVPTTLRALQLTWSETASLKSTWSECLANGIIHPCDIETWKLRAPIASPYITPTSVGLPMFASLVSVNPESIQPPVSPVSILDEMLKAMLPLSPSSEAPCRVHDAVVSQFSKLIVLDSSLGVKWFHVLKALAHANYALSQLMRSREDKRLNAGGDSTTSLLLTQEEIRVSLQGVLVHYRVLGTVLRSFLTLISSPSVEASPCTPVFCEAAHVVEIITEILDVPHPKEACRAVSMIPPVVDDATPNTYVVYDAHTALHLNIAKAYADTMEVCCGILSRCPQNSLISSNEITTTLVGRVTRVVLGCEDTLPAQARICACHTLLRIVSSPSMSADTNLISLLESVPNVTSVELPQSISNLCELFPQEATPLHLHMALLSTCITYKTHFIQEGHVSQITEYIAKPASVNIANIAGEAVRILNIIRCCFISLGERTTPQIFASNSDEEDRYVKFIRSCLKHTITVAPALRGLLAMAATMQGKRCVADVFPDVVLLCSDRTPFSSREIAMYTLGTFTYHHVSPAVSLIQKYKVIEMLSGFISSYFVQNNSGGKEGNAEPTNLKSSVYNCLMLMSFQTEVQALLLEQEHFQFLEYVCVDAVGYSQIGVYTPLLFLRNLCFSERRGVSHILQHPTVLPTLCKILNQSVQGPAPQHHKCLRGMGLCLNAFWVLLHRTEKSKGSVLKAWGDTAISSSPCVDISNVEELRQIAKRLATFDLRDNTNSKNSSHKQQHDAIKKSVMNSIEAFSNLIERKRS